MQFSNFEATFLMQHSCFLRILKQLQQCVQFRKLQNHVLNAKYEFSERLRAVAATYAILIFKNHVSNAKYAFRTHLKAVAATYAIQEIIK